MEEQAGQVIAELIAEAGDDVHGLRRDHDNDNDNEVAIGEEAEGEDEDEHGDTLPAVLAEATPPRGSLAWRRQQGCAWLVAVFILLALTPLIVIQHRALEESFGEQNEACRECELACTLARRKIWYRPAPECFECDSDCITKWARKHGVPGPRAASPSVMADAAGNVAAAALLNVTMHPNGAVVHRSVVAQLFDQSILLWGFETGADLTSLQIARTRWNSSMQAACRHRRLRFTSVTNIDPSPAALATPLFAELNKHYQQVRDEVAAAEHAVRACKTRLSILAAPNEAYYWNGQSIGHGERKMREFFQLHQRLDADESLKLIKAQHELEEVRGKLAEWDAVIARAQNQVIVNVETVHEDSSAAEVMHPCRVGLDISYHVRNARWSPVYALDVSSAPASVTAGAAAAAAAAAAATADQSVRMYAEVRQDTGVDWNDTAIAWSLADLDQPVPDPLHLQKPFDITAQQQGWRNKAYQRSEAMPMRAGLEGQADFAALGGMAEAVHWGQQYQPDTTSSTSMLWRSHGTPSIRAGRTQRLLLAELPHDVTVTRYLSPRQSHKVFVQLHLRNDAPYALPQGEAEVWLDGRLAASDQVIPVTPADTMYTVFAGTDDMLSLDETVDTQRVSCGSVIFGDLCIVRERTFRLHNRRTQPVPVLLVHRIPISSRDTAQVKLLEPVSPLHVGSDAAPVTPEREEAGSCDDADAVGDADVAADNLAAMFAAVPSNPDVRLVSQHRLEWRATIPAGEAMQVVMKYQVRLAVKDPLHKKAREIDVSLWP